MELGDKFTKKDKIVTALLIILVSMIMIFFLFACTAPGDQISGTTSVISGTNVEISRYEYLLDDVVCYVATKPITNVIDMECVRVD